MAKRIFFIVVALLLIASALAAIPNAIIESMEWIRMHIYLIGDLFDGYFKEAFYMYFDYGMIKAPWLNATLNYLNYNISILFIGNFVPIFSLVIDAQINFFAVCFPVGQDMTLGCGQLCDFNFRFNHANVHPFCVAIAFSASVNFARFSVPSVTV